MAETTAEYVARLFHRIGKEMADDFDATPVDDQPGVALAQYAVSIALARKAHECAVEDGVLPLAEDLATRMLALIEGVRNG
jgi:hypothetical protein